MSSHNFSMKVNVNLTQIGSFPGIYILYTDSSFYIGSSKNINKRVVEHLRLLSNNIHYNHKLQSAYNINSEIKYGTVEHCSIETLLIREQYYIDSLKPDLNISAKADRISMSPEEISLKQGGERNHMNKYKLEDIIKVVLLRNTGMTMTQISKEVPNITLGTITAVCSGVQWCTELNTHIPNEYNTMLLNRSKIGKLNQAHGSNSLFTNKDLLDIVDMIISRNYTLEEIAQKFNTNKTTISSIKCLKTYSNTIKNIAPDKYAVLTSIPKGKLKL